MTIGNQVLTGTIQKLKKPLLVTDTKATENDEGKRELRVRAIINTKYVFKHRPKIVLMNTSPSKKSFRCSQIK